MKRFITLFLSVALFIPFAKGQYVADALKYSFNIPAITARSMSMGGAFVSLGGDFSSTYLNPAGLGLYRKSEFTVSPGVIYSGVGSTYYNQLNEDFNYQFFLGNLGYVGTYNTGRDNGFVGASFAAGYNRHNNLGQNIYIGGINPDNSLTDYFMQHANFTDPENLDSFYERLAFDAYIIDTIPGSAYEYQTPVFLPVGQRKTIDTKGGIGEWTFSTGVNFDNVFYAGMGLGIKQINYSQTLVHRESDDFNHNDFNNFAFTEDLEVKGSGVSLNMGVMVRVAQIIRIGGSLHLPTFYRISEEYFNTLRSEFDNGSVYDIKPTDTSGEYLDAGTFKYKLHTPLKLMGGASVQIGSIALVAADVEFVDYSNMRLRESDIYTDFQQANRDIESIYRKVLNLKLGGEFRIGNFNLRAGGGYYPSPYEPGKLNADAHYKEITAGFGYRDNNVFFDLGLSGMLRSENYIIYWENAAELDYTKYRVLATFGVRL